jgi:hypothetical protein
MVAKADSGHVGGSGPRCHPHGTRGAIGAFDEIVAESSGHYVWSVRESPVPLIHATAASLDQIEADVVVEAVEVGDEHAIKLAEMAVRHDLLSPDVRYAAASHAATVQIRQFL